MRLGQAEAIIKNTMAKNFTMVDDPQGLTNRSFIPMLEGEPGLGKTSIVGAVAKHFDALMYVVRLSDREPTDVTGWHVPAPDNSRMIHIKPDWLAAAEAANTEGQKMFVFFDEIAQGATAAQNTVAQCINERMVGEYNVPPNTFFLCASNAAAHRAGTNHMPTHVRSRLTWLEIEADVNDTVPYFTKIGVSSVVCAYLRFRSEMLSKFDRNAKACPSPRSWQRVSETLDLDMPDDLMMLTIAGIVGEGPAHDFMGFRKLAREVPDMDKLIAEPDKAPVPSDLGLLYAIATELSARFSKDKAENIVKYLRRIPKQDITAATCADIIRKEGRGVVEIPAMRSLMADFGQQLAS